MKFFGLPHAYYERLTKYFHSIVPSGKAKDAEAILHILKNRFFSTYKLEFVNLQTRIFKFTEY